MKLQLKQIIGHRGFRKYFANTSWLFAEKMFRMLAALFIEVWMARYLGAERFGLLSFAQSFVMLFTAFATLGLDGIVVRELVKNEKMRDVLIGTAFWLKLGGALTVLSVLLLALLISSGDAQTNTLVFIIASATIFQSFNVIDFYFQSKVLSKYVVLANSISLFVTSSVKIYLILSEASLVAFAWVILLESIVLSAGLVYFYAHKNLSIRGWRFDAAVAKRLLSDSWPLILSGIAVSINMRLDQVMIKWFLGAESVGLYAAAVRIAQIIVIIPHLIMSSIFPAFVNAHKDSAQLFIRRISLGYRNLFYLCAIIGLTVLLTAEQIMLYSFGAEYRESIVVLKIASVVIILSSIDAVNAAYLKVENLQRKLMIRQWINVILNIILNFYLIQIFGIVGAMYSTIAALVFSTIIYDMIDRDLRMMNRAKLAIFGIRY